MFRFIFFIAILFFPSSLAEKLRFDNYVVYTITPQNSKQVTLLQDLQNNDFRYDFWNDPGPNVKSVSIMSSPQDKVDFEAFLSQNDFVYNILSSNIQSEIDNERILSFSNRNTRMDWTGYFNLDDINSWIDELVNTYSVASEIIGGTTYEGREIKGIKISHGSGRQAIFVEGGIHSREWISPATVTYIINQLLTSTSDDVRALAEDFDWYLFPVTNPDGYVWTHTENRMWRKNRKPMGNQVGIDLNRNWNNNWLVAGASANPVSDAYAGHGPFSEIETRTLSNFISSIGHIELYLSFHSYGQMLLLPFGNTTNPLANYDDAMVIGRSALQKLSESYGTQYTIGNVAETIYLATGGSIDWAKERLNISLVYCYELRDQSTFILPPDQILPTATETLDSIVEIVRAGRDLGYFRNSSSAIYGSVLTVFVMFIVKNLI